MITCKEILQIIDRKAPFRRAEEWDNVGLLIGDPDKKVERILFSLDVTQRVVQEAIEKKAGLIVSHHPVLFSPIKEIRWDTYKGKMLKDLMANDICVLCAHTNVDIYPYGINGFLADRMGLIECEPLRLKDVDAFYKLAVFVPRDYVESVLHSLFEAGAGKLGLYEACAFRQDGLGQFKPVGDATPFIGERDVLEIVEETKVEVLVSHQALEGVLTALFKSHPYEEPAFDLFELKSKQDDYGLGVVGDLKEPLALEEFIDKTKGVFGLDYIRYGGAGHAKVQRIAICSGSGGDLLGDAIAVGAEVYITGDLKYHEAQNAMEAGVTVLDVGHHASEVFAKGLMLSWVEEATDRSHIELLIAEEEEDFLGYR